MKVFLLVCFLVLTRIVPIQAQTPAWEEQNDFVNGYARVFHLDKFTFISSAQQFISSFVFEDARNFYHRRAAVKQNNKWGFINTQGKLVIPCKYEIVFNFYEKVTVVSNNNKWWLVDSVGRIIKQLDITVCHGFLNGKAEVYKNNQRGIMDTRGVIIFESATNTTANAQLARTTSTTTTTSVCPDNLDFEFGNFTNWKCFIGRVDSVGNTNVITVTPSPPTPGRHTMYARSLPSAIDAFGLFPTNPPDGSNYAVRLGNTQVGAQAERIQYTIHVPLNDSDFSFRYHYAVVLQDPGHTPWTQPRFTAKLLDSATNTYIDCASFEYISTANLPGFQHSTVDTSVIYKTWSPVFINLRGYGGKTLYLEFSTADCVRRAHWGYAYVDVENMCGNAIQFTYDCNLPHAAALTGPPGFQAYNWWDQGYTTLLGTGQTINLNPGPPPNSLIWLQLIPFANFGCTDTIPVRLHGTMAAHFDATDTFGICAPHGFTFYNRNLPSATATWDFGDATTGTGDTVTHVFNNPGTYIVTMTVTDGGGCVGVTTDTVKIVQPTGSFAFTGGSFCGSHQVQFTATTQYVDSLSWDFGDGTILNTTQTTVTHTYAQPGIYIPHVVIKANGGCQINLPGPDTVRIEKILPGYDSSVHHYCGYSTLTLTDTSHAFFGIASQLWTFGDGTTATGSSVTHNFTSSGFHLIKLIVTGVAGCIDSTIKNIYVKVNDRPVSGIIGDTSRCANGSLGFTGTAASLDPMAGMGWTCSNGTSGTGNTFNVAYPAAGTYTVQLITETVNGCYDTTHKTVIIHPIPIVTAGSDRYLCLGRNIQLNAGGATQYSWSPSTGLSCTNCPDPVASPTDTTQYIVTGTSSFGCVGVDTFYVRVIKPFLMPHSPDDTICTGKTVNLMAAGADLYNWFPSTGLSQADISNPVASPVTTTTYQVIGYDGYHCFSDTANIKITVGPIPTVDLGTDLTLATGDVVTLSPTIQNGPIINWLWEPAINLSCSDCGNPRLTVHDDATYTVTVTNQYRCVAKDVINISTFCKSAQVFIPNAFTPDGDGLNDILMVRGKGIHVNYFRIFSRWGELIFERNDFQPNDPQYGWDGRIRGVPASPDVFVYTAQVVCDNNIVYSFKGNTSLLK